MPDSGIETVLIFHHGYDLPDFAAFVLLDDEAGVETLRSYYRDHAAIARDAGTGFIFESPTWRASPDWAARLGYIDEALAAANRKAIDMLVEIRSELDGDGDDLPMVVSGCVGPRGDGYQPSALMTADEAQSYHSTQIGTFAGTEADMVTGITITYPDTAPHPAWVDPMLATLTDRRFSDPRWLFERKLDGPELVAEVAFAEWTTDGRLRHPRFVGLRDDKRARDVVREAPPPGR